MEPWAAAKKNFQLVWRCHQLLSGFLAKDHLPRVLRQSHQSLMIRVVLGTGHRSPGICLTAEKTSARRPSDEGSMRPVIASNGVPFLQIRSVGSHSASGREKEGIKERMGCYALGLFTFFFYYCNINFYSRHISLHILSYKYYVIFRKQILRGLT